MKKIYFILFCMISAVKLSAQNEFITVWQPNIGGTITNNISFGGTGTAYQIVWEEIGYPAHTATLNSVTSNSSTPLIIDFGTPSNPNPMLAKYKVKVSNGSGLFYGFRASNNYIDQNANSQIVEVSQWGNTLWLQQFNAGFAGCPNLNVTATDVPNLTQQNDLSYMFFNCKSLVGNPSFSNWNTSTITKMANMFSRTNFNQNIGSWNTSLVTDFSGMFNFAQFFNQNLSGWNTSSGTNFSGMFKDAIAYNQPMNTWNVSNGSSFRYMFSNAALFNQPLNQWNTGNSRDFEWMFENAVSFNQPIGTWNVSNVNYYAGFNMFSGATQFNQDISTWNIHLQNFSWGSINFNLNNTNLSCENYNNFLIALNNNPTWASSTVTSGIIAAAGLKYSTSQAILARAQLINKGFTITGDTFDATCLLSTVGAESKKTRIYPNPTSDFLHLIVDGKEQLSIINQVGQLVRTVDVVKGENQIDLSDLPVGVYILKGQNLTHKILKK